MNATAEPGFVSRASLHPARMGCKDGMVIDGDEVYEYVGIGWVPLRTATAEDRERLPVVVDSLVPDNEIAARNLRVLTPMQREAIDYIRGAEAKGMGWLPGKGWKRTLRSLKNRGMVEDRGGGKEAGWHLTTGGRWALSGMVRIYGNL